MAKTRALVKRRKAIQNIRKITRTMELIATARIKKALDRAVEAEAFTRKITELAADLSASGTELKHPLLEKHESVKNTLLLVLTSNRGLCGGYNAAILRESTARIRQIRAEDSSLHLELSGKRAIAYYRFQRIAAEQKFTHFEDKPTFEQVDELANRYIKAYGSGAIDRVDVAYTKFLNAAKQVVTVETLLPLSSAPTGDRAPAASPVDYEFLPDAQGILEEILPVSFKVRLFKCFLDAAVSEQIARRVAMKAATENAQDIIKLLTSQYNRARQAQITKEIAEVIGGAEALKMIRDEAYHLHALRTNGKILKGLHQLWEPKGCWINPERVIKTLNKARVGFVVIGAYGLTGYRDHPQATGDMDILIRRSHHKPGEAAIAAAFPKLAARKEGLATRWEDPHTGKILIDLWRPNLPLLKVMWKHVVTIKGFYQIPCLEMVLACKLTTMLSSARDFACRYLDAGDFMNIVETNRSHIDLDRFQELAEVVVPGRSRVYVKHLRDTMAGRTIRFLQRSASR